MENYLFWLLGSAILGNIFKFADSGFNIIILTLLSMVMICVPYLAHVLMYKAENKKGKLGAIGFWNIHKILKEEKDKLFCQQKLPRGIFSLTTENEHLIDNFSWHAEVLIYKNKAYLLDPISFVYITVLMDIFWIKAEKITFKEYMNRKF